MGCSPVTRDAAPQLQYEPNVAARPVVVEHDGDLTRIIVPMQGPYAPTPWWVSELDLLSIVLIPIWVVVSSIVRSVRGISKPPRALFEVSRDLLTMTLTDVASGERISHTWPRAAVI